MSVHLEQVTECQNSKIEVCGLFRLFGKKREINLTLNFLLSHTNESELTRGQISPSRCS